MASAPPGGLEGAIAGINKTAVELINRTIDILNRSRSGPYLAPNAPPLPQWAVEALLYLYAALLSITLMLLAHYIYYARGARLLDPPPPASQASISVIIPVKGEDPAVVAAAVERVRRLPCSPEVIVVSDDEPQAFEAVRRAAEGRGARAYRREGPRGYRGLSMNWAAGLAGGDVLVFLDVDSIPPPDLCGRAASALGERGLLFLGWDGYTVARTLLGDVQRLIYRYLLYYTSIVGRAAVGDPVLALGSGIAVDRRYFQRIGGFCNCIPDDYDISIRTYLEGGSVRYTPGTPVLVEIPPRYGPFKRQFSRWTYNSAYLISTYLRRLLGTPRLSARQKASLLLNLATHPLAVTATFATMAAGLVMGYMGVVVPPLYILALQAAVALGGLAQAYQVYRLARADGYRFFQVLARLAQGGAVLLAMSPYLAYHVLLGLLRRPIRWHVTPKGPAALAARGLGAYEVGLLALLSGLAAAGVLTGNWTLAAASLFSLAVSAYGIYVATR